MQVASLTNCGLVRSRNEDSCFVKADTDMALLVVADGMGGHQAGNVASSLAISAAEKIWNNLDYSVSPSAEEARKIVNHLIVEANKTIFAEANNASSRRGMGTTLTAGLLCGKRLTIGHVGDSRAYLIKDGSIELLTKDHSLLEQLIESGQVRPEEAQSHPQRHIVTRALGLSEDLEVDIFEEDLDDQASLLFCTDGLTNLVYDDEILDLSKRIFDPQILAKALIDLANERGGYDNVTVVIAAGIGGQRP